jgi:hypothetical protein
MGSDWEVRSASLIRPSFAKLQEGLSTTVPHVCIQSELLHVRVNATYICTYIAE